MIWSLQHKESILADQASGKVIAFAASAAADAVAAAVAAFLLLRPLRHLL